MFGVGENGSGKTTFIQILAGKLEADEKSIQLYTKYF